MFVSQQNHSKNAPKRTPKNEQNKTDPAWPPLQLFWEVLYFLGYKGDKVLQVAVSFYFHIKIYRA